MMTSPFESPQAFGLTRIKFHDARSYPGEFAIVAIWRRTSDDAYLISYDEAARSSTPFDTKWFYPDGDMSIVRTRDDIADYARDVGFDEAAVAALLDGLHLDDATTAR